MGNPVLDLMKAFMAENDHAILLVEQHAFVILRLLIERAREGLFDEGLTADAIWHLQQALLGATSLTDQLSRDVATGDWLRDLDKAVAFFVQNGAYNRKPQPMGELVRSQELYARLARDSEAHSSAHFCPLDDWMLADYKFNNEEQLAFGFALSAMTTAWSDDESAGSKSYIRAEDVADVFVKLGWEDRHTSALDLLSADRGWYAQAFSASGDSIDHIAWELRPFMQRPFLRLASGGLVLLSPRVLAGWVTDGFHYRLLDAAQARNSSKQRKTSRAYTAFAGDLLERYCLALADDAFRASEGGTVYPEQPYGKKGEAKTSDIAIHIGTDLVLIEITASRLRADTLIARDPRGVREDLNRLVVAKARQLDGCINALAKGTAQIPAADPQIPWEAVERVWPVITAAGEVIQNEYVWEWIRRETTGLFSNPKVQPLVLLDLEDFEVLMGLAEHGLSLVELLRRKTAEPYRDLELAMAVRDDPSVPHDGPFRLTSIERAFETAVERAMEYFDMSKGVPPTPASPYTPPP